MHNLPLYVSYIFQRENVPTDENFLFLHGGRGKVDLRGFKRTDQGFVYCHDSIFWLIDPARKIWKIGKDSSSEKIQEKF